MFMLIMCLFMIGIMVSFAIRMAILNHKIAEDDHDMIFFDDSDESDDDFL